MARLPTPSDLWRIATLDRVHFGFPDGVEIAGAYDHSYFSYSDGRRLLAYSRGWPFIRYPDTTADALGGEGALYLFTVGAALAHAPSPIPELATLAQLLGVLVPEVTALPIVWETPMARKTPVPTFQPHWTLNWGGTFDTGPEAWSNRLNLTSSGTLMSDGEADTAFADFITAVEAWQDMAPHPFGATLNMTFIKLNKISANGKYTDPGNTRAHYYSTPRPAPNNSYGVGDLPYQCAVAVSLLTSATRGKAHRGRMYLPAINIQQTGGRIGDTLATYLATGVHDLIAAVNAAATTPTAVSVISTTGESHHVIGTACGHIIDTLRTRRRSLVESPYLQSAQDL